MIAFDRAFGQIFLPCFEAGDSNVWGYALLRAIGASPELVGKHALIETSTCTSNGQREAPRQSRVLHCRLQTADGVTIALAVGRHQSARNCHWRATAFEVSDETPAIIERLAMNHRIRIRKFTLALVLALGVGNATAVPACLSAKAASSSSVAPGLPTTESECARDWASITPVEGKARIENPHRLSWQEWSVLAGGLVLLGLFAAGLARLLRRRPSIG